MSKLWQAKVCVEYTFECEGNDYAAAQEDAVSTVWDSNNMSSFDIHIKQKKEENQSAFIHALEHWADWFKSSDDDFADEIVYLLTDKAHDVREDMKLVSKMRSEAKEMCETAHREDVCDAVKL